MSQSKEFEIILPTFGGIGFGRSNVDVNKYLLEFLSEVADGEVKKEITKFFEEVEDVEVLFGDDSLCG